MEEGVRLAPYTTLRLGGNARAFVTADTEERLVELVSEADRRGEPVLILGGGSNLVLSDTGFDGLVVKVGTRGIVTYGGLVTAAAGEDWDPLVERCVAEGLSGIECLSGIPGLVGSTPIQNVGAYGQDVSQTIVAVRVFDRRRREILDLEAAECGFAYRDSAFKGALDRFVVLSVTYHLESDELSQPLAYAELARSLGVAPGERVPLARARARVLELRRGKGMVLDPDDPDTVSAGSFFTNPILGRAQADELEKLAPGYPRWPAGDDAVKVPAAWLIENAGFHKGYAKGRVRVSTKHTLALTNPTGEATADELLELAREVRDGVKAKFGVTLVNEPVMIGVSL